LSHLRYSPYEEFGKRNPERFSYNQAVRVGDEIECPGQGSGCGPKTGEFRQESNAQIDQVFASVDLNLKDAGGKGWEQVYGVNPYHVPMNNEAPGAMVRNFNKWMPNHKPIRTCVGVTRLAGEDMRVESGGCCP
ncbi:endoribonuclease L-PSP, partial [Colletotrichum caudatum]